MDVKEIALLLAIASNPGLSGVELAETIEIPQQTASRIALMLGAGRKGEAGRDLIEAVDDPMELRRKIYFLTREGSRWMEAFLSAAEGRPLGFKAPSFKEWQNNGRR